MSLQALFQFRVDAEMLRKAQESANAQGRSLSDVLREFLQVWTGMKTEIPLLTTHARQGGSPKRPGGRHPPPVCDIWV